MFFSHAPTSNSGIILTMVMVLYYYYHHTIRFFTEILKSFKNNRQGNFQKFEKPSSFRVLTISHLRTTAVVYVPTMHHGDADEVGGRLSLTLLQHIYHHMAMMTTLFTNSRRRRLLVIGFILLGTSFSTARTSDELQSTTTTTPGLTPSAGGISQGPAALVAPSRRRTHGRDHHRDAAVVSALPFVYSWRGGAGGAGAATKKSSSSSLSTSYSAETQAYAMLGRAVASRMESLLKNEEEYGDQSAAPLEIADLIRAFRDLSQAQQTFKGLDGAAHEAYQRTHNTANKADKKSELLGVSGRALRTAARTGAVADAIGACELCELASSMAANPKDDNSWYYNDVDLLFSANGTLANRQVLLNATNVVSCGGSNLQVLVLYEVSYRGGAGLHHGGIEDLGTKSSSIGSKQQQKTLRAKGRILIVLGDPSISLSRVVKVLSKKPIHVRLSQRRMSGQDEDDDDDNETSTGEAASVQPELYRAATALLLAVEPILRQYNESAIHIVGHSLAGGVASLAATILEGSVPLSGPKNKDKKESKKSSKKQLMEDKTNHTEVAIVPPLQGLGKGRTSAVTLGAPPSISANVRTDFITSILYGDDIVGRACSESMDRFYQRTRKALKKKGLFTRQLNRMTDTLSLATSSLKSHAHGSEGEEARLAIAGRAYLIRPRRLGSACSMHEIGASQLKGGREALRAAVLWQLNDILLSKSFWKHHQLQSYIHGLDRVHLRGLEGDHDD
jgi:Lipase (class 3)